MSIRVESNEDGTFDVISVCDGGCKRRIEQSNITAPTSLRAAVIAADRLKPEGWEGGTCRACLLHHSGWQSDRFGHREHGGRGVQRTCAYCPDVHTCEHPS